MDALLEPNLPSHPGGKLILASDGNFYGATRNGGDNHEGIFFKVTPTGTFTELSSFGGSNGPNSMDDDLPCVQGSDGNFYGLISTNFSPHEPDALVRVTPLGVSSVIFNFVAAGVGRPTGLVAGADGNLYGTTGDPGGSGAAFKLTPGGAPTFIASFDVPPAQLLEAGDGNFYGILRGLGDDSDAKVFKMTPSGVVSILHLFDPLSEGTYPGIWLVGNDGSLYGPIIPPGSESSGALFRLSLSGEFTRYSASAELYGGFYEAVLADDGNFYTSERNHYDPVLQVFVPGRVARVTPEGAVTVVRIFSVASEGLLPESLTIGADGNLYGPAALGGPGYGGTIFKLSTSGTLSSLHSFSTQLAPPSALVEGEDGRFYGTAEHGGSAGFGNVFRMSPAGEITPLVDFSGQLGALFPQAALLRANDGNFYGTASGGGPFNSGAAFRLTPGGQFDILQGLHFSNGQYPAAPLVEGDDGFLYGTAPMGGSFGNGTIFKISTAGTLTTLVEFTGTNGAHPACGLTKGQDGSFYGLTTGGAAPTAFRVTPDGTLTTLHTFLPSEGSRPLGELVLGPEGNFYGTNGIGGTGGYGSIFRLNPSGEVKILAAFTRYADLPQGGLILGRDNHLYAPGPRIQRVTRDGIVSTLITLDAAVGLPRQHLLQTADNQFYGVSSLGSNIGQIYRARLAAPEISALTPEGGSEGSTVVISGKSFTDASRISFGGVATSDFVIDSDAQITAAVPAGVIGTAVSITTPVGVGTFPAGSVPPAPAVNISTRAHVGTADEVMIGGFIIQGGLPKKVIVRAIGPSLAAFGVSGVLLNPALELHQASGAVIGSNDDWGDSPQVQEIIDTTIAPSDSHESAIVATLNPGSYTAVVRGVGDTTGVALVEVYDLDRSAGRLANISTRGQVQTVDRVMIGGFIVAGDAPGRVLVRAIGPSLGNSTPPVPEALDDPQLELRDSDGNLMASNDDWKDGLQRQQIEETTIAPAEDRESAIIATLNPGNYTAVVYGSNNSTGIGLIEVYKLD